MSRPLVIVGSSARAAACSALRAGFTPYAADLFADADLAARCQAVRAVDYPRGLIAAASGFPTGPWMYTGALENSPDVIDAIAGSRPLWGNVGQVVNRVRDPLALRDLFAGGGFRFPTIAPASQGVPADGTWLKKRRRSAGGAQVSRWLGEGAPGPSDAGWYFQEYIEGRPCAALYVAAEGRATLLGATEQLLSGDRRPDFPFRYEGSCGPIDMSFALEERLASLGDLLARAAGLQGVFGLDFVLVHDEPWPIEVNPRYPASAEIIERAIGVSVIGLHAQACRDGTLPNRAISGASAKRWHGKRILYATSALKVDAAWHSRALAAALRDSPSIADVPVEGTVLSSGQPIATVFAEGGDREQILHRLQEASQPWQCQA